MPCTHCATVIASVETWVELSVGPITFHVTRNNRLDSYRALLSYWWSDCLQTNKTMLCWSDECADVTSQLLTAVCDEQSTTSTSVASSERCSRRGEAGTSDYVPIRESSRTTSAGYTYKRTCRHDADRHWPTYHNHNNNNNNNEHCTALYWFASRATRRCLSVCDIFSLKQL